MGAPASSNQLFADMYRELHRLAHARLQRSEPLTLLDTTALVHETWLRFMKAGQLEFSERSQLLAYAAHVMRSIIVDAVRQRHAGCRGGDSRVTLDTNAAEAVPAAEDEILRVSEALDGLARLEPKLVEIVEMRYFAGLSEQEIAANLGVASRTVRRHWEKARLMLSLALR